MNMARQLASSWGRTLGSVIALIFVTFGLVACGGGGGASDTLSAPTVNVSTPTSGTNNGVGISTPSNTGGIKTIQSVTINFVTVNGVNIDGTTVEPTVKVEVTYGAGGTVGSGTLTTTCGDQQLVGTLESATVEKLVFTHPDWKVGACTGVATVSATGFSSATSNFAFTVNMPATYTTYDMIVTVNGIRGTLSYVERDAQGKHTLIPFVNKTGYDIVALCGVPYVGDNVWIHSDGVARFSCVTPAASNQRRTFKMTGKGELGSEDTSPLPANVTLRDVPWGVDLKYNAYFVNSISQYIDETDGVLYLYGNDLRFAAGGTATSFASPEIISSDYVQFLARVNH